jgi:hypothetical protein
MSKHVAKVTIGNDKVADSFAKYAYERSKSRFDVINTSPSKLEDVHA